MKLYGIKQCFGARVALDIPQFEFDRGRIYAILGSNGCGKSTLARIISGVMKPSAGTVEHTADETCGYMPQKSYAFYGSVYRNIRMGLSADADESRIAALIDRLGLAELANEKAKRLSGGETARMALARTLAGTHSFLVLDEPTAALDVSSTLAAEQLIGEYRSANDAGVLLITHSISQASRVSDHIIFIDEGRICEEGSAKEHLANPATGLFRDFIEVVGA